MVVGVDGSLSALEYVDMPEGLIFADDDRVFGKCEFSVLFTFQVFEIGFFLQLRLVHGVSKC